MVYIVKVLQWWPCSDFNKINAFKWILYKPTFVISLSYFLSKGPNKHTWMVRYCMIKSQTNNTRASLAHYVRTMYTCRPHCVVWIAKFCLSLVSFSTFQLQVSEFCLWSNSQSILITYRYKTIFIACEMFSMTLSV